MIDNAWLGLEISPEMVHIFLQGLTMWKTAPTRLACERNYLLEIETLCKLSVRSEQIDASDTCRTGSDCFMGIRVMHIGW